MPIIRRWTPPPRHRDGGYSARHQVDDERGVEDAGKPTCVCWHPSRWRTYIHLGRRGVGIALVIAAGVWVMVALAPTYAEDLSVENPNEYPVQVQTRGSDSQGWLSVGTVPAGQTYDPRHVLDQGETWTFRFSHRDIAVERTYQRHELDARGWQVTVPDELEQRLQQEGITPQESSPFEEPSP